MLAVRSDSSDCNCFFCKVLYEKKVFADQKKEISIIYPELADELSDNISYYAAKSIEMDFLLMLAAVLLTVTALVSLYFLLSSENKRKITEAENELNDIYEQLLRFQNGHVDMLPLSEESRSQKFVDVYDKLRDLGYYFSNLKERLTQEENSTKALITDISHQLKTPLASIRMSHELSLPIFLWAKNSGMFNIRNYHYPVAATLMMIAVLVLVQVILVFETGKSVKKDSLIDRIRNIS